MGGGGLLFACVCGGVCVVYVCILDGHALMVPSVFACAKYTHVATVIFGICAHSLTGYCHANKQICTRIYANTTTQWARGGRGSAAARPGQMEVDRLLHHQIPRAAFCTRRHTPHVA